MRSAHGVALVRYTVRNSERLLLCNDCNRNLNQVLKNLGLGPAIAGKKLVEKINQLREHIIEFTSF